MREDAFEEDNIPHTNSPKKDEVNRRGWVFLKTNRKSTKERINEIVESRNKQLDIIKPYNIANYA